MTWTRPPPHDCGRRCSTTRCCPYDYNAPEGYPEILEVDSRKYAARGGARKYSYANFWHTDVSALVNPPAITFLRSERHHQADRDGASGGPRASRDR
ncbi:hypothetical protein MLGJGCBP_07278 [Rhodococcus sp. T7]|nr:hypothetical protein MLGJGCBP_07278 [Rhodococcus sp. T7]